MANQISKRNVSKFFRDKWATPFGRFSIGFTITLILCLLWPFSLLLATVYCPDPWTAFTTLLRHEQTYTTAHHLCFSPAVGLFTATVSRLVLIYPRPIATVKWSILVVLLSFVALFSYRDVFEGPIGPHQSAASCDKLKTEADLRDRATDKFTDAKFESDLKDFQSSLSPSGLRDAIKLFNLNGWVSGFLTWFFMSFCVVYIWYCVIFVVANRMNESPRELFQLIFVAIFLLPWIPLRVYTDWHINSWQTPDFVNSPVDLAVGVSVLMAVFFVVIAIYSFVNEKMRETGLAVLGAIGAALCFIFSTFPGWVPSIHARIDRLPIEYIIGLSFLGVLLVSTVVYVVLTMPNKMLDRSGGPTGA